MHLLVLKELRILAFDDHRHFTQLSSDPHLLKLKMIPSLLHEANKTPESFMVLCHCFY